jgi:hypothetical protein
LRRSLLFGDRENNPTFVETTAGREEEGVRREPPSPKGFRLR